jgi:hypothetical protein
MTEPKTVALRAVVGFHALTQGEIIHVDPEDPHYVALLDGGFLAYAYPEDDPGAQATILQVNQQGDETTILGVRPARQRRTRRSEEVEYPDGATDSESA